MHYWITYRIHYGRRHSPVDSDPNTYSGVALFGDELAAMRFANENGVKAIKIFPSQTLEEAIQADRSI